MILYSIGAIRGAKQHEVLRKSGTTFSDRGTAKNRTSERERETARLIADCKSTKQIAAELGLSIKTTETHRANAFAKLQVHSVAELVR